MSPRDYDDVLRRMRLQEGGLIEVCISGTSRDDWRKALQALKSARYETALDVQPDGTSDPEARGMFSEGESMNNTLTVRFGHQRWTTQFYSESLIDFQGDPNFITTNSDVDDVVEFMSVIGMAVKKGVRLIPESLDPAGVTAYLEIDSES